MRGFSQGAPISAGSFPGCSFAQTAKTTSKAKVGQVDVTKVRVTLGVALFEGTFAETGDALDVGPASGNRRQSKRWRELSSMVIDEGANCRVVRQQGPKDSGREGVEFEGG
jgi:hypothetical protein